ncbi:MAG: leucyl aminopeptidase, partial [Woeseiaceae bacterium]|nr:leucyl aminopeptidase [Woeseiaceae bacterium]
MEYFATSSKASKQSSDCVIVGVFERNKLGAAAADIDKASKGVLTRLMKTGDISGQRGRAEVLTSLPNVRAKRVVVVGLGKPSRFNAGRFRKAVSAAMHAISKTKTAAIANYLALEDVKDTDSYYLGRHTAEAIGDVMYRYDETKSGRKPPRVPLKKIGVGVANRKDVNRSVTGLKHGDAISAGMSVAKELGNLPPNICTPSYLARFAQKMARGNKNLSAKILNETEMKRLGMGSLLSVTAGAAKPAKMVILQYKGGKKEAPVVLVGKGVTFDTGGISLKPGAAMDEMKFDMCGAAGVIGTMATVAKL